MDSFLYLLLALAVFEPQQVQDRKPATTSLPKPVDATVCQIAQNPSAYNNKLVRIRGFVEVSAEYSILDEANCSHAIWFVLGNNVAPPGLVASVRGKATPGSTASGARVVAPIPVHLVEDSAYRELMHFLELSAKGDSCTDGPPPAFPPECTTYRISATFTGRIDSVSKEVHEAHVKHQDSPNLKGFGHMGMFESELVVQTVENVVAQDKSEISPRAQ